MTSGIGNPDWQRRYEFSAVPLFSFSYDPSITSLTSTLDANGYTNLILNINSQGTTAYNAIIVFWYADAAATNLVASTDVTPTPNATQSFKFPVMTRYYKVETLFVTGVHTGTCSCAIYGTNSDEQNLLTQNTDVPILRGFGTIAAGATSTVTAGGTYGGMVNVTVQQNTNNNWHATIDYFDKTTSSFRTFWTAYGHDEGQAMREFVNLPYTQVRMNVTNDDAAAQGMIFALVAP